MILRGFMRIRVLAAALAVALAAAWAGPAGAADDAMLQRMEALIRQQQAQIEAQAQAIEELKQQVNAMAREQETIVKEVAQKPEPTPPPAEAANVVTNQSEKVKIQAYGQVNRAVLAADDGDSSDYYNVDNDNSSSRVGLLGSVAANDDLTIGARMEFEYQSNPSNVVNQLNKEPDGASFDDRWIDLQIASKRFGKLYLGKGSTASDNTSEVDLSGTDVIGYSSVVDMAGGILFYDKDTDALSTVKVSDAFSNFDGLGRRNRIRYDTPEFWGFTLSASAPSDGGDVALRYAAKWGEALKFAAAAAYANPKAFDDAVDDQYAGSASVLHDSGLSLTVAGGMQELEDDDRDDPVFYYGKIGYRHAFFDVGESRFSVDYNHTDDLAQDGDDADSVGLQFVQDFSRWGTEFYLGYRWHALDRDDADFDDINAVMSGLRVKF
jgi:predicted porin